MNRPATGQPATGQQPASDRGRAHGPMGLPEPDEPDNSDDQTARHVDESTKS